MRFDFGLINVFVLSTLLLSSSLAHAASPCVALDDAQDTLSPVEQKAALRTFENALLEQDANLESCDVQYVLFHSRLGDVVTVFVSYGTESRTLRASSMSELPKAYDQIAISLITGTPLSESTRRDNVMESQADRSKEDIDTLVSIGFGASGSRAVGIAMPSLQLSWLIQTDTAVFGLYTDLAFGVGTTGEDDMSSGRIAAGLDYSHFFSPNESSSFYVGTGIGYEGNTTEIQSGHGFVVSPLVGIEFFRTTAARVAIEGQASLPLYELKGGDDAMWNPALTIFAKVAFEVAPEILVWSLFSR